MGDIQSYRDLQVWQGAMDTVVSIYRSTDTFPKSEMYGLTSQIRRSAVSIPSNIAEGHSRPSKDYARFLSIARGSLNELETPLELARRIGYLPENEFTKLTQELSIIGRQLNALLRSIKNRR